MDLGAHIQEDRLVKELLAVVLFGGDEIPEAEELHRAVCWFEAMLVEPTGEPDNPHIEAPQ